MVLKLHNTLSKKVEEFLPIVKSKVKMYSCGPTVYDYAHIGNFRSFLLSDLLRRTLEYNGYKVKQVINITDVGHLTGDNDDSGHDKIEEGAKRENKSAKEIADFYTQAFFSGLAEMNIKTEGTIFPKATEHIAEQIDLIKKLEQKGFAYKISDGVYFNTAKVLGYGKLAHLDVDSLKAGARVEANVEKKNPTDFALWKFSKPEENRQQEWDSPWGVGFPGWHVECSAMSMKYLGEHFDIHTGGIDHIQIHHTNEIAQSECATGEIYVNYWLHNEFVLIGNQKMAKSENNFLTLDSLKEKNFTPLAYRYMLLGTHYRKQLNFTFEGLEGAQNAHQKLVNIFEDFGDEKAPADHNYVEKFEEAISNDLATPQALAVMWEMLGDQHLEPAVKKATLLDFDQVLGLGLTGHQKEEVPSEITELANRRETARQNKDFTESDRLRNEIKAKGYLVEDSESGPKIRKV